MSALSPEFLASLRPLLGEELSAFAAALEGESTPALRFHRPCAAARRFAADAVPWAQNGFYVRAGTRPGASVEHFAGAFYLQEASAMLAAAALDAQPGERVLDLCAAPGGKSSQIALALAGEGLLVSNEPEPARARVLAVNLERLGVCNAVVTNETPARLAQAWPRGFDAVLTDAPCSGEGMFRREIAARDAWSPAAPRGCAGRQRKILDSAALLVRPGGRLVYSTCTFNAMENEETVAAFLDAHREFSPEDFFLPGLGASRDGMLRLWPHRARGDGHFVARLRRTDGADASGADPFRAQARRAGADASETERARELLPALLRAAVRELPAPLRTAAPRLFGGLLFAVPAAAPTLTGLKVVSPGVALLRTAKNRVEPEHALAMALAPGHALREAALSRTEALAFIRGEALTRAGEAGWTLVTCETLPLGWGKQTGETLKNHLPKGLRKNLHP